MASFALGNSWSFSKKRYWPKTSTARQRRRKRVCRHKYHPTESTFVNTFSVGNVLQGCHFHSVGLILLACAIVVFQLHRLHALVVISGRDGRRAFHTCSTFLYFDIRRSCTAIAATTVTHPSPCSGPGDAPRLKRVRPTAKTPPTCAYPHIQLRYISLYAIRLHFLMYKIVTVYHKFLFFRTSKFLGIRKALEQSLLLLKAKIIYSYLGSVCFVRVL